MIMSSSRLRIILVCALIGGCIGTVRQALLISGRTKEFRSLAKLVATMQMNFNDNACWREQQLDWYGMIIETLESAEMKRRASERVKALHPDLKDSGVTIRAIRSKNTSFFNLLATSPDPKYTRIFLGALIDEFFAFRESLLERADGKVLRQFFEEVEDHQKKLEDLTKTLENARAKLASLSEKSDQERLIPRLKMLKLQRDGLRLELNPVLAVDPSRVPVKKSWVLSNWTSKPSKLSCNALSQACQNCASSQKNMRQKKRLIKECLMEWTSLIPPLSHTPNTSPYYNLPLRPPSMSKTGAGP